MEKHLNPEDVSRMVSGSFSEMLYICQKHMGVTEEVSPEKQKRLDEMQKELTELICSIIADAKEEK